MTRVICIPLLTGCGLLSGPDPADPAACIAFEEGEWELVDGGASADIPTEIRYETAYQVNLRPEQVNHLVVSVPEGDEFSIFSNRTKVVTAIDDVVIEEHTPSLWCDDLEGVDGPPDSVGEVRIGLGPSFQASAWIWVGQGPVADELP